MVLKTSKTEPSFIFMWFKKTFYIPPISPVNDHLGPNIVLNTEQAKPSSTEDFDLKRRTHPREYIHCGNNEGWFGG